MQAGGPCWEVQLGRRDSRRANLQGAIDGLPSPFENVTQLKRKFDRVDLDSTDLVALSGKYIYIIKPYRFKPNNNKYHIINIFSKKTHRVH